jgi:hypothetical protein
MRLHEIKKLLYNRRYGHQIEETANRVGEIFASYISNKRLITRIYKELKNLSLPK